MTSKEEVKASLRKELVRWFKAAGFEESEIIFTKMQNENMGERWGMGGSAYGADGGCVRHAVSAPQQYSGVIG